MNGKRVLVTGGGSGAGADLALGFAKAGAQVVICGRRVDALAKIAARHSAISALDCDVTDEGSVHRLFAQAGPLDIVIANATSKAILRAAAAEFVSRHDDVDYFPSYEMVSYSARELAWRPDQIHVNSNMVSHIVKTFCQVYYGDGF